MATTIRNREASLAVLVKEAPEHLMIYKGAESFVKLSSSKGIFIYIDWPVIHINVCL